MKIISRQTRANETATRFKDAYYFKKWSYSAKRKSREIIYNALIELGITPNPDTVDKILGNTSWTEMQHCSSCEKENPDFLIELGEEPRMDSATAYICEDCMHKAIKLMEEYVLHQKTNL